MTWDVTLRTGSNLIRFATQDLDAFIASLPDGPVFEIKFVVRQVQK